jgi:hypothetical protein
MPQDFTLGLQSEQEKKKKKPEQVFEKVGTSMAPIATPVEPAAEPVKVVKEEKPKPLAQQERDLSKEADYLYKRSGEIGADSTIGQQLKDAKEQYQKDKETLEWREAIEKFSNAIGQLGAAFYGSKHNVDLSNLKLSTTDWDRKLDRVQREYELDLNRLQAAQEKSDDRTAKAYRDRADAKLKLYLQDVDNKLKSQKENQKLSERQQLLAEKKSQKLQQVNNIAQAAKARELTGDKLAQEVLRIKNILTEIPEIPDSVVNSIDAEQPDTFMWIFPAGTRYPTAEEVAGKVEQIQSGFEKGAEAATQGPAEEIERLDPKTGKTAIFNASTKQFIRWK